MSRTVNGNIFDATGCIFTHTGDELTRKEVENADRIIIAVNPNDHNWIAGSAAQGLGRAWVCAVWARTEGGEHIATVFGKDAYEARARAQEIAVAEKFKSMFYDLQAHDRKRDQCTLQQEEQSKGLRAALVALTDRYCALVNCGDCGHWDPETEEPVKQARAALIEATKP